MGFLILSCLVFSLYYINIKVHSSIYTVQLILYVELVLIGTYYEYCSSSTVIQNFFVKVFLKGLLIDGFVRDWRGSKEFPWATARYLSPPVLKYQERRGGKDQNHLQCSQQNTGVRYASVRQADLSDLSDLSMYCHHEVLVLVYFK